MSEFTSRERPERGSRDGKGGSGNRDGRGARAGERSNASQSGPPQSGPGAGRKTSHGPARKPEPELPEHLTADLADRSIHRELRTLSKENAEGVARHLLAVSECLDAEELDLALAHAQTATRRAGRVPIVREMLGVVHYRRAEWSKALSEFRTARRMSGSHHLLPLMADTERGLGRPERAIELSQGNEVGTLKRAERMELAVVVSGARLDLGQTSAAVQNLREAVRSTNDSDVWAARVFYAYADALISDGQADEGQRYLSKAASVDESAETDAAERLAGHSGDSLSGDDVGDLVDLDMHADDQRDDSR